MHLHRVKSLVRTLASGHGKHTVAALLAIILGVQSCAVYANADNSAELTALFTQLKTAPDQETAVVYENKIWNLWFQSGSQEIDELMQIAMKRRNTYDFNGALEILNQVIALNPNYPEVWNQRATVHFHQEKYREALEDVAKTLELEPRHFGALAGRAIIRLQQLKPVIARRNIADALKIHPFLKERHYFPDLAN